jgi:predicted GNAT family acetyltransferase
MQANHVLDNPVWHALNSHHAHLAIGTGLAKYYPSEVNGAAALAEHSEAAYRDLVELVGAGGTTALFEAKLPQNMPDWTLVFAGNADQMVCQKPVPEPENTDEVVELTAADVPDMLQLIAIAQPGPFLARTIEMGRYFGIRQDGMLVAMAGQRFRLNGYCEVSAVCTHPDWRGKGYARLLSSIVVNKIWKDNSVPFLHVDPKNALAIRIYESLNFVKRCEMTIHVIRHS